MNDDSMAFSAVCASPQIAKTERACWFLYGR